MTDAPSAISQLDQRIKQLDAAKKEAQALPAERNQALDRKNKLIADIDRERAELQQEKALRQGYLDSTKASAADPKPADPVQQPAWAIRETQRATQRAVLAQQLDQMHKANPALYGTGDVGNPCLPCHAAALAKEVKAINKLARVEILNGCTNTADDPWKDPILSDKAFQWVNLLDYRTTFDRDTGKALPKWLQTIDGRKVRSFDRLSRKVRILVEFTQPGVENFEVKLIEDGHDVTYTAAEQGASDGYHVQPWDAAGKKGIWVKGTTNADGKAVVETAFVRASGGDQWHAEGTDDYGTKKKSSGKLLTARGLFLGTMTMDKVAAISTSGMVDEFARHHIFVEARELEYDSAADKLPYSPYLFCNTPTRKEAQKTVLGNAAATVWGKAKFSGAPVADLLPYVAAAIFYDQSPGVDQVVQPEIGGKPKARFSVPLSYAIWDPGDVATVDWYVTAIVRTLAADGTETVWPTPTRGDFETVGNHVKGFKELVFKPSAAMLAEKKLFVEVETRIFSGGLNGFSRGEQGGGALVAICRRSDYATRATGEMNQTIVHEIGHKVNFTTGPEPAGAGTNGASYRWLDASPSHYSRRGHNGGHCYKGAKSGGTTATALVADFSIYDGHCVMFGAGGAGSARKINFCPNCAPRMKKINLETGWPTL